LTKGGPNLPNTGFRREVFFLAAGAELALEFGAAFGAILGSRFAFAAGRSTAGGEIRHAFPVTEAGAVVFGVGALGIGPIAHTAGLAGFTAGGADPSLTVFAGHLTVGVGSTADAAAGLTGVVLGPGLIAGFHTCAEGPARLFSAFVAVAAGVHTGFHEPCDAFAAGDRAVIGLGLGITTALFVTCV